MDLRCGAESTMWVKGAFGRGMWQALPACQAWLQQSDCRQAAAPRSIWQMPPGTRTLGSTTAVPSVDRARGAVSRAPTARSNRKEQPPWESLTGCNGGPESCKLEGRPNSGLGYPRLAATSGALFQKSPPLYRHSDHP
jgi:hypothetical protein